MDNYWNHSILQLPNSWRIINNLQIAILWHCKNFRVYNFDHVSCVFVGQVMLFDLTSWELCLEHILEIAWCVNILSALSSLLQHIYRCFCARGCSFCWVYEKISRNLTMMFLVWWSTISDSHNAYSAHRYLAWRWALL